MTDQCHSEIDIVNYILPYIIVINFKIFYNKEMAPAKGICDPLGTCSSFAEKMWVAFANAKAPHIFSAKILAYNAIFNDKVLKIH